MKGLTFSSPSSLAIFSPKPKPQPTRFLRFTVPCNSNGFGSDLTGNSSDKSIDPLIVNRTLSKDEAMGLVLSAASVGGWKTDSGLEGPSVPTEPESGTSRVSTFPWSLFTKSPRRRMLVAFSCNVCGQRTTRAINPHAYTDGTVFVQCCGCNVFHKLVDNLNLFNDMKCYVDPSFKNPNQVSNSNNNVTFKYIDNDTAADDDDLGEDDLDEGGNNGIFPLF
ncbi:uncharacterized protein LOC124925966 [Impatiens glandulifera]|uniref:uncharacterized protein LOC124925966 n=1 Tax=Impatiens glandulifera TaxID=253017 RepID=UPI001FB15A11|nr:uncharacterized protein LOC124925966 [Impatiens glandulifera]